MKSWAVKVCKMPRYRHNSHLGQRASILAGILLSVLLTGCGKDRSQLSDSELELNAQQSRGRKVYNIYCLSCHPAYSSRGDKGPGLKDLYKRQYLPSGLTPTDEHVEQSIISGRNMMPPFGN